MHRHIFQTCLLTVLLGALVWFIGCGDKKETVSAVACQGVACWDPPEQTCAADQDDCLSVYNAVGWCAEGICDYAAREEECLGGTCVDGLCEETPCLGTTCATAPDYRCLDETTLLVYNPIGYCASSGGIPECRYADKSVTCENGCENGACKGDPCLHKICFKPPARHCDGDNVVVWDSIGGCEAGECVYGFQTVSCAGGCENGHCVGTDPCSVMTCNVQPASFCVDGVTLRTYASDGSCDEAVCYYDHTGITCASGCENGQCKEQECAGVICDIPIASYCREGGTLNHWDGSDGACEDGVCSYESTSSACAPVCSDAKCEDDPCIGVFCTIPPANYCTDDATLVEYEDTGACSDGHCGYESGNTACADACEEGECVTGGDTETDGGTDRPCDPTISWYDSTSGLCWQDPPSTENMWWPRAAGVYDLGLNPDSENYCTDFMGSGWRLPSINELRSLFRRGDAAACQSVEWLPEWTQPDDIPTSYCGVWEGCTTYPDCYVGSTCNPIGCDEGGGLGGTDNCYWDAELRGSCNYLGFWSSSRDNDTNAWLVDFYGGNTNGQVWIMMTNTPLPVRCVRTGP